MRINILKKHPFDGDEPAKLMIGEACILWINPTKKSITMACPKCGETLGLVDHTIVWHDENTITVEPSVVHKEESGGSQILHKQCGAHFYIRRNEIIDLV